MRVRYHPEARRELAEAAIFYEQQRYGLGSEFRVAVRKAAEIIGENPQAWSPWVDLPGVRTYPLRRFPFLLPYAVQEQEVVVLAVAHARQRPGYWMGRL